MTEPKPKRGGVAKRYWRAAAASYRADARLWPLTIGALLFVVLASTVTFTTMRTADAAEQSSFWISLSGSLVEGAVFFTFVGAIGIVISLANPADDEITRRVSYFFNRPHLPRGAATYLAERLKKYGMYSPDYEYNIVYGEFSQELGAFKASAVQKRQLYNMFKDEDFVEPAMEYSVVTDCVGDSRTLQGELTYARISGGGEADVRLIDAPEQIFGPALRKAAKIRIPEGGSKEFEVCCWVWHKVGTAWSILPNSYSDRLTLQIENKSDRPITLTNLKEGKELNLAVGDVYVWTAHRIPAGELPVFELKG